MMGTRLLAIVLLGLWPIYCTAELAFNLVHSISTAPSSHRGPHILFRDEHPPDSLTRTPLRTNRINVHCPRKQSLVNQYSFVSSGLDDWDSIEVDAPDVEDRLTLLELAKMTGNAYAKKGQKNWYDVDQNWNMSVPVGWEDDDDGFRGHVFLSNDNSTVVLSIKGTTLWGTGGNTSAKDKKNDNLLFSCCCARVDFSWRWQQVCDCYTGKSQCSNTCLQDSLADDSLFYTIGINLFNNLTYMYPNANIWLVGHSLGGSIAGLLGATFGVPTVAFEAPGERLASQRLHLPTPPSIPSYDLPITHVYHNADPVPLGACTGVTSLCAKGGYAMETRCHLGKSIVYDTVGKLGWGVRLTNHKIAVIITKVLELEELDWEGRSVPMAAAEEDCVDCFKWEFVD